MDADDSENKQIASKYGVDSYPTLKIFKDEGTTVLDFRGEREKDDIIKVQPSNIRTQMSLPYISCKIRHRNANAQC